MKKKYRSFKTHLRYTSSLWHLMLCKTRSSIHPLKCDTPCATSLTSDATLASVSVLYSPRRSQRKLDIGSWFVGRAMQIIPNDEEFPPLSWTSGRELHESVNSGKLAPGILLQPSDQKGCWNVVLKIKTFDSNHTCLKSRHSSIPQSRHVVLGIRSGWFVPPKQAKQDQASLSSFGMPNSVG